MPYLPLYSDGCMICGATCNGPVNSDSDSRGQTICQCIFPLYPGLWLEVQDCSIWLVGRFAPLASGVGHEWHSEYALEYQLLEGRRSHAVEI
jgi:hypothetical protein